MRADNLIAWVLEEQADLWNELLDATKLALNGGWSIRCGHVARRIVEAARLVGPTAYGRVPWALVAGGVYAAVLTAAEVPHELPHDDEWRRLDELMSRYGTTRAQYQARYAPTVACIRSPREQEWLQSGSEE